MLSTCTLLEKNQMKNTKTRKVRFIIFIISSLYYSADLNYPDETNETWIFKHVFLKLG